MSSASSGAQPLDNQHPGEDGMRSEVLAGLSRQPRQLPSKYFYDAHGSALFEAICEQPEYYVTRAELALMESHATDIAAAIGAQALLLEYGSGSGIKTRRLLESLDDPVAYVPVEISRQALADSVEQLGREFPQIQMLPVCADFTQPVTLPTPQRPQRCSIVYFPGSTIGNFDSSAAVTLLQHVRTEMGANGGALIGVDLVKDPAIIEAAYNDAGGVTARFTLNILTHINRELGADFDLDGFAHEARYNPMTERIETALVSRRRQQVTVAGEVFGFDADERIVVEYSCKYSPASFAALAARAGLRVADYWQDPDNLVSLQLLVRT